MITFTIGLGTSGTLTYDKNYKTQASGDYFDLIQGTKNWPIPTESTNGGDPTNIDDLWHAAVNGRGRYFSAGDPNEVVNSLSSALIDIAAIVARLRRPRPAANSRSPATTISFQRSSRPASGRAPCSTTPSIRRLGQISTTSKWDAAAVLDQRINAGTTPRRIYYFQPAGSGPSGSLRAFTYANLTADSKNTLFDSFCSKSGAGGSLAPLQCGALDRRRSHRRQQRL
jgi:type IV pilus assembly protein PilY1